MVTEGKKREQQPGEAASLPRVHPMAAPRHVASGAGRRVDNGRKREAEKGGREGNGRPVSDAGQRRVFCDDRLAVSTLDFLTPCCSDSTLSCIFGIYQVEHTVFTRGNILLYFGF
jgi:hypothetical protein